MLERDPILAPQLLRHHEPKRSATKRMKRMCDPNLLQITGTSCI
jgi:hypothetical protein